MNDKHDKRTLLILALAIMLGLSGCGQAQADKANTPGASTPSTGTEAPANQESGNTAGASGHGSAGLPADSMISASQLDQGLKEHQNWQIIDVREPSEFASGHVPTAKNIPLRQLESNLSQIPKDQTIVLVDLNGTRSYTAWQKLKEKEYDANKLKVLVGGMEQWKNLGSNEITESIGGC